MARKIIINPYKCPVTHAMNIIGGKWKPIIVYILSKGSLRFGKFLIFIPSISRKVLTNQLREMEADGLLIRKKFAEIPPRVEYSLTESGKKLIPIFYSMADWSKEFAKDIVFETLPE